MKLRPLVSYTLLLCSVSSAIAAPSQPRIVPPEAGAEFGKSLRVHQLKGKLTLGEAVNLALRQNPEVLRALREIERSRGQVLEVRAQALPHIALTMGYDQIDPKVSSLLTQNKSWRIALEVKQILYSGGQVGASVERARLTQDAAYYSLRDAVDRVVSQVRQQFSNVLATKALIDVAAESVDLASQQLKDATNRFEAGTVPRFNVLRAEVEVASVRPGLIRAKNDYLIAQLQLAKTLGLDAAPSGKPSFECEGDLQMSSRPLSLSEALSLGRARRPSLKAQRQLILIEKENITIAISGFKPRIEARAGQEIKSDYRTNNLDDTLNGYFLGVLGSWKIFDSFETSGQVAQAKARMETAIVTYDDALQTVELEVQKSYAEMQQFRETVESQRKNVEQAVEALRLSQERLSAGAGTQLEVLDARVALTRARTTELQARAEYVRALAEFDRATATETVYTETFKDPLSTLEKKVLRKTTADLFKP